MSFVYPWFLVSLVTLSIPIIIHLFNLRRYKTVFFPDIRFIKQINLESKSKSRIKHLLILISRILALTSLILAFAQPIIKKSSKSSALGRKAISIYVDNSFSMNLLSSEGSLLQEAKSKALQVVKAYGNTDLFQLITNDLKPEQNILVSKDQFIERLSEVKISTVSKNLSEIHKRQCSTLKSAEVVSKYIYEISDFQKSTTDISKIASDTIVNTYLVSVKAQVVANVSIDSCWFEAPVHQLNKTEKLHLRLKNQTSTLIENLPVKLFINGSQKTIGSVSIPAKGIGELVLSFLSTIPGINQCSVEITDYPITFDDKLFFTYQVQERIAVLTISDNQAGTNFGKIFKNDSAFSFLDINSKQIDYNELKFENLIILNQLKDVSSGMAQELIRFVETGGALCIVPDAGATISGYNDLLTKLACSEYEISDTAKSEVLGLNYTHPIFKNMFESVPKNMDLPNVNKHFRLKTSSPKGEDRLISLKNGDPMLITKGFKKGKVYVFTNSFATEATNFYRHPLVVPVFWEIAISSISQLPLYYNIGNTNIIELSNISMTNEQVLSVVRGEQSFIPEQQFVDNIYQLKVRDQIKEAGFYQIIQNKNALAVASFNLDRRESDIDCLTDEAVAKMIKDSQIKNTNVINDGHKDLTFAITEMNSGIKLWKLFILLSLLFFAIEIILIRFFK